MNAETFCDHFATFADAPNGIARLREMILQLAVQGKLVPQDPNDEPASILIDQIQAERLRLIAEGSMRRNKPLSPVGGDEFLFKIPKNWRWIRFDDVGDWGAGATPNRGRPDYFGGDIKWLKSGELNEGYIDDSEEKITALALKECSLRENQPGDVLVAMYGATIGKVAILNVAATTNQAVCACTCHRGIFNRYLFLMLKAFKPYFISNSSGAAQPNFSKEKIVRTPFPLPPLAEQKRIVEKVDQLMKLCDELAARQAERNELRKRVVGATFDRLVSMRSAVEMRPNAKRVRDHFDQMFDTPIMIPELRKAILQLAVQGQLVPQDSKDPERNKENKIETKGLFEIPNQWRWVMVEEIAESRLGKMLDKAKNKGKPFAYLRNTNVHWFRFDLTSVKEMPFSDDELSEFEVRIGDVLICEGGHGIGRTAVWNGEIGRVMFQKALHRIRPSNELDGNFFAYCMKVYDATGVLQSYYTGAGIPHLTGRSLAKVTFPLPPLSEQQRIVAKVDELMCLCDSLEAKLTRAEAATTQLLSAAVHLLLNQTISS